MGSLDCEGGRQGTAMGKRKSSAPPPEKKKQKKVPTTFNCPFCEGRKTVGVELKYKLKVATVKCRSCKIQWSCKITCETSFLCPPRATSDPADPVNRSPVP